MKYKDAINKLIKAHLDINEYYAEFKNLFPMVPKEEKWDKTSDLISYYYNHIIAHSKFEEELINIIGQKYPEFLENVVIKKILSDHQTINSKFEILKEKSVNLDESMINYAIEAIDSVLIHAKYEDDNFITILEKFLNL